MHHVEPFIDPTNPTSSIYSFFHKGRIKTTQCPHSFTSYSFNHELDSMLPKKVSYYLNSTKINFWNYPHYSRYAFISSMRLYESGVDFSEVLIMTYVEVKFSSSFRFLSQTFMNCFFLKRLLRFLSSYITQKTYSSMFNFQEIMLCL